MSYWRGRVVFVTGADGFIGGNLAAALVKHGAHVIVLERDARPVSTLRFLDSRQRTTVVRGDLIDHELLFRVLNEYGVELCFHLAAQALVGAATTGPMSTFESNIRGTYCFLEACRRAKGITGVVVASSDKAYGVHEVLPYTEEAPLDGLFPYDASKACTDILARSYHVSYGLPVVVTRNANVYGPGDLNFSRLVPDCIRCAIRGDEFQIRSDGKAERDYLYIDDAVNAYLTVAEQLGRPEVVGQAFNFGTETPVSVLAVCEKIAKLVDVGRPPRVLGTARNEIPRQYLASKKARELLGWIPRTSLDAGLEKTVAWYRETFREEPWLLR